MRKLSDTITRLRALRSQPAGHGHHGVDRLSSLGDFGSNPGALNARTYLPRNLGVGAPLVVVLHGCTQTAAAYDFGSGWSKLADQQGFALLFPEQQRSNNPNLCFNWFVPSDIRRDSGEALSIRQMIETMVDAHDLDLRRIFVTGLSAGGAMAAVMLATYPEVFAGGAIIAGLPFGTASTIPHAFDRMRGHGLASEAQLQRLLTDASPHTGPWPTISIWQGSSDQTVAASNAKAILGQWRGVHGLAKAPTRSGVVDGQARQVWSDAKGRELVEVYTIEGMGHGTPLGASGEDGLGSPGPFMLDVGISSTRHIARFWGLAKFAERQPGQEISSRAEIVAPRARHVEASSNAKTEDALPPQGRGSHPESQDTKSAAPTHAAGVQKVIEDALRAAGLMR